MHYIRVSVIDKNEYKICFKNLQYY
uniref:Uncharacterized protein n=1 Tax=Anguilla anguilla TaxID=7936 RepID=A0A0E9SU30_ANGAN